MRQFFLVLVLVLGVTLPQGQAGGGGRCAQPVTESQGNRIVMERCCFSPTVMRVRPGTVVTFMNEDAVPHVVTGAHLAWGAPDVLEPGREARCRFDRPGTFPYMCHLHMGMAGAIIVGR